MRVFTALAGFLAGLSGGMGLGGGAFLILYLSLFADNSPLKNQGINLIFFVPIAAVASAVYIFKKEIDFKTVLLIAAGGVAGAFIGYLIAKSIEQVYISKLFGAALAALGIYSFFRKSSP